MKKANFKILLTENFKNRIIEAAEMISPDQDEIEIPDGDGQMLVRIGSEAEQRHRKELSEIKYFEYRHKNDKFLVCVK